MVSQPAAPTPLRLPQPAPGCRARGTGEVVSGHCLSPGEGWQPWPVCHRKALPDDEPRRLQGGLAPGQRAERGSEGHTATHAVGSQESRWPALSLDVFAYETAITSQCLISGSDCARTRRPAAQRAPPLCSARCGAFSTGL